MSNSHYEILEYLHDNIVKILQHIRNKPRIIEKLASYSDDPESDARLATHFWETLCDLLSLYGDWYRRLESYKLYYGNEDLPQEWEKITEQLKELVNKVAESENYLKLPEKLKEFWSSCIGIPTGLDDLLRKIQDEYEIHGNKLIATNSGQDEIDDDDDDDSTLPIDDDGSTTNFVCDELMSSVCHFDSYEAVFESLQRFEPNGFKDEEASIAKKQLDDRKKILEDLEKSKNDFYQKYRKIKFPLSFRRGMNNSIREIRHSRLRLSWLEERNSFLTRFIESEQRDPNALESDQLLDPDACKKVLDERKNNQQKDADDLVKKARNNSGQDAPDELVDKLVENVRDCMIRLQTAISEIGFHNFIHDALSDRMRGGKKSPLFVDDYAVLSCLHRESEFPDPKEILIAVYFDEKTVDFNQFLRMVFQYLRNSAGKTKAVLILTEYWGDKSERAYSLYVDEIERISKQSKQKDGTWFFMFQILQNIRMENLRLPPLYYDLPRQSATENQGKGMDDSKSPESKKTDKIGRWNKHISFRKKDSKGRADKNKDDSDEQNDS